MDVRLNNSSKSGEDLVIQENSKLTDALIYNIIKKLQLKEKMQEKYETSREPFLKDLPYNCGRFIHSAYAFGYVTVVMLGTMYMRYKARKPLSLKAFIPHIAIAVTINEFERYRGIINFDKDLKNQYRSYQTNTAQIIKQSKRRLSLTEFIKSSKIITPSKIFQMLKYKSIY